MTSREIRIKKAAKQVKGVKNDDAKELNAKLDYLIPQALNIVKAVSPVRSGGKGGGLRDSFNYRMNEGSVELFTNKHYMPYTEEKWISPRWNGRQNPNQDWFKGDAYPLVVRYLALGLGGNYVLN